MAFCRVSGRGREPAPSTLSAVTMAFELRVEVLVERERSGRRGGGARRACALRLVGFDLRARACLGQRSPRFVLLPLLDEQVRVGQRPRRAAPLEARGDERIELACASAGGVTARESAPESASSAREPRSRQRSETEATASTPPLSAGTRRRKRAVFSCYVPNVPSGTTTRLPSRRNARSNTSVISTPRAGVITSSASRATVASSESSSRSNTCARSPASATK